MPRHYGRVATSIWRDPDFRELDADARFTYVFLVTQADITAAGTTTMPLKRWATALGIGMDRLDAALVELEKRRYIIVDHDTEELLIRTFVKWDGGAENGLRRKAISSAADAIESASIADVLAVELDRVGVPHGLSKALRGPMPSRLDTRRVVVTTGEYLHNPQPATVNPQPGSTTGEPEPIGASAEPPSMFCKKHPEGTEENCGPCKTARLRWEKWQDDAAKRQTLAEAERKAAIRDCPHCNDQGFVEDFAGNLLDRCDRHQTRRSA